MDHPAPSIIDPLKSPHKQTFIILHGRGSSGNDFGPFLLHTPIVEHEESHQNGLASCFPHARFVFPTAVRRRAALYRRALNRQWFDHWKLDPPGTDREQLQVEGLHETTLYLHSLLRDEIALVPGGAPNVVFGGLSQGCAASLVSLLLWEQEPLAAYFGMCGWLPFAKTLSDLSDVDLQDEKEVKDDEADFDPFGRDGQDEDPGPIGWLRDELKIPQTSPVTKKPIEFGMPLFFRHGIEDDVVSVVLGRGAHRCVTKLGFNASLSEYSQLGHWYSEDMLRDMVAFIREKTQWKE